MLKISHTEYVDLLRTLTHLPVQHIHISKSSGQEYDRTTNGKQTIRGNKIGHILTFQTPAPQAACPFVLFLL